MDPDRVIVDRLSQMGFRAYSQAEILKLSVKEVTNPQLFDNLQLPTIGGLYDPALGSSRNDEECTSCGQSGRYCPGHMGHINLPLPVFNPIFFKTLFKILQGSCLSCHRLYVSDVEGALFVHRMKLLERGNVVGSMALQQFVWNYQAEKEENINTFSEDLVVRIKQVAEELDKESSDGPTPCTKMVDAEMSELVSTMLKRFFSNTRMCPHCKCETLVLRQEYFSRISVKSRRNKRPSARKTASKRKPAPARAVSPETEMELFPVQESEERDEVDSLLAKGKGQCLIMPHLAQQILRKVWLKDGKVLRKVFRCLEEIEEVEHPTDMFFLTAVLVPPSRFRPVSVMKDRKFENPQTANLSRVLTDSYEIRQLLVNITVDLNNSTDLTVQQEGNTAMAELQLKWLQLQTHINCLIDSDLDKISNDANKLQGIRQLLEKKEGLFRMHMMGKRVNFAARSVISPDPCINTNQIGVPAVFAQKLTYPQPVTPWNVHELRQYVINGPNNYPGASAVVNEDGSVTKLSPSSLTQREAVAKQLLTPSDASGRHQLPKQVLRHLKDGDVMLLNRQPTLHRPSIQAHRARVLPGLKTLRLHYSNCKAYNADFDGDEMNAHFPQSELCRAEAYGIASTDFQYLVPKDGSPLAGLIQDHLVAGVALTIRGQFFFRDDYCNLLQSALTNKCGRIQLLHPAIVYPQRMWSGKQVISTLLLNVIPKDKPPFSLDGRAKINERRWVKRQVDRASHRMEQAANQRKSKKHGKHSASRESTPGDVLVGVKSKTEPYLSLAAAQERTKDLGESTVLIDHGELLQGVLDKAQCGPSSFGLVHCVYELYGGEVAGQLLTCLGRLFTAFLKLNGFTLGMEDILVNEKAEAKRSKEIESSHMAGQQAALEAFGVMEDCSDAELLHFLQEAHCSQDRTKMNQLDASTKVQTNKIAERIMSVVGQDLFKSFPDNNLQLMVESGAKGSMANCQQISSLLGQIELEGRRPPLMSSGRSLPSFTPYDLSLRAGGFVTGRFLTGIRPQEYFFHCMAGREGLIDTAVKTSRSGYLQRCLVKHLEGVTVSYDMTVRDSDASIIQFIYGEDGLEVSKTPFLEEKQMPFLLKNQHVIGGLQESVKVDKRIEKHKKKVRKWLMKHPERKARDSGFLDFCRTRQADQQLQQGDVNGNTKVGETSGRLAKHSVLEVEWRGLDPRQRHKFMKKHRPCPDPVLSKYWPQLHSGAISEKMQDSVNLIQQQLREVGQSSNDRAKELQSVTECDMLTRLVNNKVMRSLCEPGEAVGLVCAQSIGEPSTQMTLNTFHFAGRGEMNVTLGIPRLREVLMTASATILTPAMDIRVLDTPEAKAGAKQLQKKLNRVFLRDVLQEMKIYDFLHPSSSSSDRIDRKRMYRIHFTILPRKCYSDKLHMKQKEIVKRIEKELIGRIVKAAQKVMDKRAMEEPADLVSQSTVRHVESPEDETPAAPVDDGESDVEANDGDATVTKELARHTDTQEYEGEEEEREEVGDATQPDDMEEETPGDGEPAPDDEVQQEAMDIEAVKSLGCVHDYQRDMKGKWCEVVLQFEVSRHLVDMKSLVEQEAGKVVLQQVKGIKRCMLIDRDDEVTGQRELHLVTEGINLQEMMKYCDVLDLNSMYTNSIVDIQNTYGIEAANKAIIKEVQSVFGAYKILVNYRHLSLLADYMTCEGTYKGFNRAAISTNPSPLQKITFETSMNFLVNSCTSAKPDHLRSPTARIVAGQVVASGTGSFEIVQPLQV